MRVVVLIHNQSALGELSLDSIHEQTVSPDRIIYIDDGIKSLSKARELAHEERLDYRYFPHPMGVMSHYFTQIRNLGDHDLVLILHGSDSLAHRHVIENVKRLYKEERVWMTYGGALSYPNYDRLQEKEFNLVDIIRRTIRSEIKGPFHLQTFYAGLFKKIPFKDLSREGRFIHDDMAMILPMIEMAEERAKYLKDVHYICRTATLSKEQEAVEYVRSSKPYSPLDNFTPSWHTE